MAIIRLYRSIFCAGLDDIDESVHFIRDMNEDDDPLMHICKKTEKVSEKVILMVVGAVEFNSIRGVYYCSRCRDDLSFSDVLSDGIGIGIEGHC